MEAILRLFYSIFGAQVPYQVNCFIDILIDLLKNDTQSIFFLFLKVFILSCAVLFVVAGLYEGIKLVREKLIRHEMLKNTNNHHHHHPNSAR